MNDRLYRSKDDRMLAGVAGGLAELWDADPSLVRIIWALLIFFTGGIALVVYIVMALVVPEEDELDDVWPPPASVAGTQPEGDEAGAASALVDASPTATGATAPGAPAPGATAPGALWAPSPSEARRQARREARAARRAAGGSDGGRASGAIIGGALLILLGAFFLLREFLPAFDFDLVWPLILVGIGVALLVYALRPGRNGGGTP
jgi:phage shock protein C